MPTIRIRRLSGTHAVLALMVLGALAVVTMLLPVRGADAAPVAPAISGTVSLPESAGNQAWRGVQIQVLQGGRVSAQTGVAPDGSWAISNVPSAAAAVRAVVSGYFDDDFNEVASPNVRGEYWPGSANERGATLVDLAAGPVSGIDFTLDPGATMSGTVVPPRGVAPSAAAGGTISAYVTEFGSIAPIFASQEATVAPDGSFSVVGLYPGSYVLQFVPGPGQAGTVSSTYFTGAASEGDATPVIIGQGGADVSGLRFALLGSAVPEPPVPTTPAPTTPVPTTPVPTTQAPTTQAPTTQAPTKPAPTTSVPTTKAPTPRTPMQLFASLLAVIFAWFWLG